MTARRVARRVLGTSVAGRAARALAGAAGRRLVFIYHRIAEPDPEGLDVVPTVAPPTFERHLAALADAVDLVDLSRIVNGGRRDAIAKGATRALVALTFDDDLPTHVSTVLPALERAGVPATFFLSGRALAGAGPYWFQCLESLLRAFGAASVASSVGLTGAGPVELALAGERDRAIRARIIERSSVVDPPDVLDGGGIRRLAETSAIGFHTLDHEPLPPLSDTELTRALDAGRGALAEAAGAPIEHLAYPHGAVDGRVAAAARRAGFIAGWTGAPSRIRRTDDRYRLGRWEPGALTVDELLQGLAVRLLRPSPRRAARRHR